VKRPRTDDIEFPVNLDLEMVLGDMPQKVRIALNVDENLVLFLLQCLNVTRTK